MARKSKRDNFDNTHSWRRLTGAPMGPRPLDTRVARWRAIRQWAKVLLMLSFFGAVMVLAFLAWKEVTVSEPGVISRSAVSFETNEQLTKEWFLNYSGLNEGTVSNIFEIERKLLEVGQIKEARVNRRRSDGGIDVKIVERTPILRLRGILPSGEEVVRVVAADGVVYKGINYSPMVYSNLPLLTNARPYPSNEGPYDVIPGMEEVGQLLYLARRSNPALYQQWESVSVREFADGNVNAPGACIRVRLRESSQPADRPRIRELVFSTKDFANEFANYYAQPSFRSAIEEKLRATSKEQYPLFDLYLLLENRTNPNRPEKQPRLIPVNPAH